MLLEISRSVLVFAHLMSFSCAIVLVLYTDLSILKNGVSTRLMHGVAKYVLTLLVFLWVTGLLIVFIDTQLQVSSILSNSKVSIKFVCVSVLTFNGMVLHVVGLKTLTLKNRMSRSQAIALCIMGALSTTNWLLAGFIGSANMLSEFSFQTLLLDYLVISMIACTCGYLVSDTVQKHMNAHRARAALKELGVDPVLAPTSFFFHLPFQKFGSRFMKVPDTYPRV